MSMYHMGSDTFQDPGNTHKHSWIEAGPLAQIANGDSVLSKNSLLVRPRRVKKTDCTNFKLHTIQSSH